MSDSAKQCPFSGANTAMGSSATEQWWPNQLNLNILHQHHPKSDPMGEGFNYAEEFKSLDLEAVKQALGERVKDVRITSRLTESPACLIADQHDMSANLERLLKAAGHRVPGARPILEINPQHPLVARLKDEIGKERFVDWSTILFEQALLAEGGSLEDPGSFVKRLNQLMLELAGAGNRIWVPGKQ